MGKDIKQIRTDYNNACENILQAFCEKYDMTYVKDAWVGGDVGTIAMVGELFIDLQDMLYCLTHNVDFGNFISWYDYNSEIMEYGLRQINLKSWCIGCPHADLSELRKKKQALDEEIEKVKDFLY